MIDLRSDFLEIVIGILEKYIPNIEVWAFGSRVAWTAKEFSDLDLAIINNEALDKKVLLNLEEAFEESDLPIKVDIVEFCKVSKEFQEIIKKNYEVLIANPQPLKGESNPQHKSFSLSPLSEDSGVQLPDGWRVYRLGELCKPFVETSSDLNEQPYIGLEHISECSLSLCGLGKCKDFKSTKNRFYSKDILYGKLRPYFRKVVIASFDGYCSTEIWVIRKTTEIIDQHYLFYIFADSRFSEQATLTSEGTHMPRAKWDSVKNFSINLPPLPEQKTIARILSSLDDKIELNRKLNKTLEEIAQTIFKSWFVDFDPVKRNMNPQPPERGLLKRMIPEALTEAGHFKYNKDLVLIAQQNRNNPTEAEKRIWDDLLKGEKTGYKFRQQKPIDNFILDFYCSALLLGIEIDGEYHEDEKQREQDITRQEKLEQLGLKIIRYTNEQVLNNFDFVQKDLIDKINLQASELISYQKNTESENPVSPLSGGWGFDHLFPSEFEESELGLIPKGWGVLPINSLISVKDGTHDSPKKVENGFPLITSKHLTKNGIDFQSAYFISNKDFEEINKRSKVNRLDILISMIGTVGTILLVQENKPFAIKNIGLFKSSENLEYAYYLYLYLKSLYAEEYLRTRLAGSTQQYLTLESLRSIPTLLPSETIIKKFTSFIYPIIEQLNALRSEAETLQQIRDSLLPKLISGEIRVNPAKIS